MDKKKGDTIGRIIRMKKKKVSETKDTMIKKSGGKKQERFITNQARISSNRMWMWMEGGQGHGREQQEAHFA